MRAILVLNAGSSSLKFALFPVEPVLAAHPLLSGQIEGIGEQPVLRAKDAEGQSYQQAVEVPAGGEGDQNVQHRASVNTLFAWLQEHSPNLDIIGAGHRVVHGGERYSEPVVLDDEAIAFMTTLEPLAPLHQHHNLRAVRLARERLPGIKHVACMDTAFHRTQPAVAQAFGLPRAISAEGVKRYGFHGTSYEYVSGRLPGILGAERANGAVVIAHLGSGASMCALRDGKSVASTMGFTAVDGLMMSTRTGNLDPGVLLYLMDTRGWGSKELTKLLYKESGLLGVSGISLDMRTLLASDKPEAEEAIELFCYRVVRELGSLAAAAGGLDALVFTGGIGEHAAEIRRRVCAQAGWLGIALHHAANEAGDTLIHAPESKVAVAVVPTNEEWMIAYHTAEALHLD